MDPHLANQINAFLSSVEGEACLITGVVGFSIFVLLRFEGRRGEETKREVRRAKLTEQYNAQNEHLGYSTTGFDKVEEWVQNISDGAQDLRDEIANSRGERGF